MTDAIKPPGVGEIKVKREPGRFYVVIGGHDSQLLYKLINGVMDVFEIFVHETHRGQGIAAELCKAAVDFARQHGYKIAPSCDYFRDKFLPEHPEIKDVIFEGAIFYKAKKR